MTNKKKWVIRILLGLVGLVIVGVIVLLLTINSIIRTGVQVVGTKVTGQTTTLESADLSILGGSLSLNSLSVANPKTFSAPQFVTLKQISVAVQTSSLTSDTIVVDDITIQDLHLTVEQSGVSSNVNTVLAEIKKMQGEGSSDKSSSGAGKQLKVKKITLKNTSVDMLLGVPGQKSHGVTVTVPEMVIQDATNPDGRVIKAADLVGQILVGVMTQAGNDINLPPEFKNAINGSLQFAGENLQKAVTGIGNAATQAAQPIGDALKGVGDMFKKKK